MSREDALSRLIAAHPLLFRGAPPRVASDLPEGWYALADELCSGIENFLGPQRCGGLEVEQIKEKFAGLRFHIALACAEPAPPEMGAIRDLITQAAKASKATCQACGAPGRPAEHRGWLATLCEQHHAERSAAQQSGEAP